MGAGRVMTRGEEREREGGRGERGGEGGRRAVRERVREGGRKAQVGILSWFRGSWVHPGKPTV